MQRFELSLRNEKKKIYERFTVFIIWFNITAIGWTFFSVHLSLERQIIGSIPLILLMAYAITRKKYKNRQAKASLMIVFAITCLFWLWMSIWWMGILTALIFFLLLVNQRQLTVYFYPDRIEYPSFPKRRIEWRELNNVILKDDWLTIDFKNNRIIQQLTEDSAFTGNEQEFNEFCRQSIKK